MANIGGSHRLFLLKIVTILFFCQVWFETAGFTIRAEDVLCLLLLAGWLLPQILRWRLRYFSSPLGGPMLLWSSVLMLGVFITLTQPVGAEVKKDALVNGIRLISALSLFFIMYNNPAGAQEKARWVIRVVVTFSFLTTGVALLQIGYREGWLSIPLPASLTELKPGANRQQGREIFALFIGDNGTHVWSSMLAIQVLTVFYIARIRHHVMNRVLWYSYFTLLTAILIRTSVRSSILGLAVSVVTVELLQSQQSKDFFNRFSKPLVIVCVCLLLLGSVIFVPSESYFVERIRQTIPEIRGERVVFNRLSHIHGRFEYASTALELFGRSPVIGNGFWSFGVLSEQYAGEAIVHAHNSYMQTLAELGLVGTMTLAWLLWCLFRYARNIWHMEIENINLSIVRKLWVANLVFVLFTALFANPFWEPKQAGFLAMMLGVLMTHSRESSHGKGFMDLQ